MTTYSKLAKRYETKFLGPAEIVLNFQLCRDCTNKTIAISQPHYVREVLEKHNWQTINPISIPMSKASFFYMKKHDQSEVLGKAEHKEYRVLNGELTYASHKFRPDLSFTSMYLSQQNQAPKESHAAACKKAWRYLAGTSNATLTISNVGGECDELLKVYFDASFANHPDATSSYGYLILYKNLLLLYKTKKGDDVALSSTEAELFAGNKMVKDILWARNLVEYLGKLNTTTKVFTNPLEEVLPATTCLNDNEGGISLANSSKMNKRTRHLHVTQKWITQQVTRGSLKVEYVPTEFNFADMLTKPLPCHALLKGSKALHLSFPEKSSATALVTFNSIYLCRMCSYNALRKRDLHRHLWENSHYC